MTFSVTLFVQRADSRKTAMQGVETRAAVQKSGSIEGTLLDMLPPRCPRRVSPKDLRAVGTAAGKETPLSVPRELSTIHSTLGLKDGDEVVLVRDIHGYRGLVDTLDPLQPTPRRGKFFAELVTREELATEHGIILPEENPDDTKDDVRPKRARVIQLGPDPIDDFGNIVPWDFAEGDHVIVPYHAGYHYTWMSQPGIEESLWILDYREPITIFRKR